MLDLFFILNFDFKVEGMSWFDSLCHSFTTIATSGFSTKTASIAAFNSSLIEYTIIFFMFLAATSFFTSLSIFIKV